jgi:TonB family protein
MKSAKRERFVVTTSVNGRARQRVWDASEPLALDHPFRWVLERTADGVRVRGLQASSNQIMSGGSVKVTQQMMESGSRLKLKAPNGSPHPILLQISPVRPIAPVFKTQGVASQTSELVVFACIGDAVQHEMPIATGYVGYTADQALFHLKKNSNGQYEIKAVGDGLFVQLGESQQPGSGALRNGDVRLLGEQDMARATLVCGPARWRFAFRDRPVATGLNIGEPDPDGRMFKQAVAMVLALAIMLGTLFFLTPAPPEEEKKEELIPPQFARIVMENPKKFSRTSIAMARPAPAVDPEPVIDPNAPSKAAEAPKEAAPKTEPNPKPALPKVNKGNPGSNQVAKAPAKTQNQSTNRSAALQSAMSGLMKGGLSKLIRQNDIVTAATQAAAGSKGAAGALDGKSNMLAPNDMKLALSGLETKLSALGGLGVSAIGGGAGGVGYSKGEHAKVGNGKGTGSFVSLDMGGATVDEGLTREEVYAVIHKHMSEVRYCYESAMVRQPNVEGKLVVAFNIGPAGKVTKADAASSTTGDPKLNDCVIRRLTGWQFPRPKGGVNVAISYPFIFKTLGGE